jgi:hypothetical protein
MRADSTYQKYNPFRRPDWRWERVLHMIDRHPSPGRCTRCDDRFVRKAREFAKAYRDKDDYGREQLFYKEPGLFIAYQIYARQADEADTALYLQGRLLAGMRPDEIGHDMGTLPQAVEWYEALFFNVVDKLKHRDWVSSQILVPAMTRNFGLFDPTREDDDQQPSPWRQAVFARPFKDASLKMFAYYGGPVLCEYMIAGFQQGRICTSPDNVDAWLDGHWATTLRARSAQAARTFEINKYNVMELFATHAQIVQMENSAETASGRQSAIEKHVGALINELNTVWQVGVDDEEDGAPALLKFDRGAAELRDDELLLVAAGDVNESQLDGLEQLTMPPPRAKES